MLDERRPGSHLGGWSRLKEIVGARFRQESVRFATPDAVVPHWPWHVRMWPDRPSSETLVSTDEPATITDRRRHLELARLLPHECRWPPYDHVRGYEHESSRQIFGSTVMGDGLSVAASRARPNAFARELFSPLPSRYNRLAAWLSMGQDPRWRREMIDHIVGAEPELVLDVACGPAAVSMQLARRTRAKIVGLDLSEDMLRQGVANADAEGLSSRIVFLLGRGEQLPFADATFDALTFTYLLRYVADPEAAISELARVVKPGGPIANLEFAVPSNHFWHVMWLGYTRWVLPVAGLVTGGRGWFDVGRFLGPSISQHYRKYPVDWTVDAWRRSGILDVGVKAMSLGGGLVMWGRRAP